MSWLNFWSTPRKYTFGWNRKEITEELMELRPYLRVFKIFKHHKHLSSIKEVDLRDRCPPVFDQGDIGSCTAQGTCGAFEFEQMKEYGQHEAMSRLFLYYNTRKMEGTVDEDSGCAIHDVVHSISTFKDSKGVCVESMWPYDTSKFKDEPTNECYINGTKNHVLKANRIRHSLDDFKQSLVDGFPIIFGFVVFESFQTIDNTGMMPMPTKNDKELGGHCILCVGYSDEKKCLIIRNSWGSEWGDKGYFYMPYEFFNTRSYVDDFWSIHLVKDDMDVVNVSTNTK